MPNTSVSIVTAYHEKTIDDDFEMLSHKSAFDQLKLISKY